MGRAQRNRSSLAPSPPCSGCERWRCRVARPSCTLVVEDSTVTTSTICSPHERSDMRGDLRSPGCRCAHPARLLTRRLFRPFFGCDRLCRLGRANHQKCSRVHCPRQPPASIDFRRVGIDQAFIEDRVIAAAGRLVTFDERDRAAGSMTGNRSVVGAAHRQPGIMQGSVTFPPSAPPVSMSVARNVTIPTPD